MNEDIIVQQFNQSLTQNERMVMDSLHSPALIQNFLDETQYPGGEENRSPLEVLRQRTAHCLDGGLFAAAALRRIGFPPLILDLQPDPGMDDDHVLALFKIKGCWGAVAKSNYSGLRYREPIHRNLRELVLSYFDDFFNVNGQKTLRFYSNKINLKQLDHMGWMSSSEGVDAVEDYLKTVKLTRLITPEQAELLVLVDKRSFQAGNLGINPDGTYKPKK